MEHEATWRGTTPATQHTPLGAQKPLWQRMPFPGVQGAPGAAWGVCVCVAVGEGVFEGVGEDDRVLVMDGDELSVCVTEGVWETERVGVADVTV